MPYPLPLTRTEAYLAYKAGVIQQSDLKPSLSIPRNGIDAWLAYWTGLANYYPIKNLGKNIIDYAGHLSAGSHDGIDVSLDDATGQITVSGQPTRGYAKVVNTYDITNLLEDGKEYTISQSAYDNKLYAQVNAIPTTGTPTYIYSTSSAKTFTVDKTTYHRYNLVIQTGVQSAWTAPQTITRTFQIEKGSSASAFEPYTGEPLILQEEEVYIAYLCGVINEYPEKCLRRVGAYLRYLISARWGRPDHPLNREELYLSLIKTQFIPSGDPSSDITIDGTAKAPFVDVKMYGDTYQQSYTGKNLYYDTGGYAQGFIGDGGAVSHSTNSVTNATYIKASENTQYVTSFSNIGIGTALRGVGCYDSNKDFIERIPVTAITNGSFQTVADTAYIRVYFYNSNGLNAANFPTNYINNIQIESGETATSYEPYVGGQASPNPDYPQTVQTVTGRQVVKVEGKNLWGGFASDFSKTSSGVTFVNKADGTITANGTANGTALSLFSTDAISRNRLITLSAGDYIISGATAVVRLEVINTSGGVVADTSGTISGEKAFSISEQMQVAVRAKMANTYVADNVTIKPMIEKGSTATAYEPYSSNDYEINLGKNLLNAKDNLKTSASGLDFSFSDNKLVVSGTPTATYANATNKIDVDLPAGDYTLSISNTVNHRVYLYVDYEDSTTDSLCVVNAGSTSRTATFAKRAVKIRLDFSYMTTGTALNESFAIQLEAGSQATTYAPYKTPIELCKLGTYQDYIYKSDGKWYVHKACDKVVFNGAEGWSKSSSRFVSPSLASSIKPTTSNSEVAEIFSDKFNGITINNTTQATPIDGIAIALSGNVVIYYGVMKDNTYREFQTWLATNNVIMYYQLATPTDTEITNTALIDQLNALKNGGSYTGTTYIKVNATDPNLPGLLYVEAPKYE